MDVVEDAPRQIGLLEQGGRGQRGTKTLNLGADSPGAERGGGTPHARGRRRGKGGSLGRGNIRGGGWSGTRQPFLKQNILCDNLASMF